MFCFVLFFLMRWLWGGGGGSWRAAGDGAGYWKHKAMIRSLKLSAPGSPSLQSEEGLEVCCFFNWSITDLQCCVYFSCTAKWFSYTYIHSFFVSFSIMVYHGILTIAPCALQQTLLLIHSLCNSLHLLIPASHSTPLPIPFPLATTSLFSMSVGLFHR